MAYTLLYTTIARGSLTGTGNALTLASSNASNVDAAVYTSLNPANQVAGWPAGTTTSNAQCGSNAVLQPLLAGSTVLAAYVVCHGRRGFTAIPATLALGTPSGTVNVPVSSTTANTIHGDITSIIQTNGGGTYSVSGVPLLTNNNAEAAWAIIIAYQNNSLPKRLLNLYQGEWDTSLVASGFITTAVGPAHGRIIYSETDMDPGFGTTLKVNGTNVTGPNNPGTTGISGMTSQFFASQINVMDSEAANVGQLDTSGTFGTSNYKGIASGVVRWGGDLTNVDMTNALGNNISSLTAVASGAFQAWVAGIQVDIAEPNITLAKSVDKNYTIFHDTITYTIALDNTTGTAPGSSGILIDTVPTGLSFIPNTLAINGVTIPAANPNPPSSVNLGTIPAGTITTITFQALVTDTIPSPYLNAATVGYTFASAVSTLNSNITVTTVNNADLSFLSKAVDKSYATCGDTLVYTIKIPNTGSTTATNVIFKDTIPSGTTFITNSVVVDGIAQPGATPSTGINIGNIAPGATTSITFSVYVQC
ncbi:MAG: hypothetical protein ACRCWY_06290 [Cellulosilyticaceae bacterium]